MSRISYFRWMGALACMLFGTAQASAQFGITPTDSLVAEFATDSVTRIFQLDFPNETGDSLGLTWRWIDGGWTDGWDVNLCDLGECYTGVPADADMLPMGPEGAGFLKLIVNSLEVEGACFLHFWVWPTGNQDALVNVYFDLRNGGVSTVLGPASSPGEHAQPYPVPAAVGQPVTLQGVNHHWDSKSVQLFTAQGALVPCSLDFSGAQPVLGTEGLTTGTYLLRYNDNLPPVRIIME